MCSPEEEGAAMASGSAVSSGVSGDISLWVLESRLWGLGSTQGWGGSTQGWGGSEAASVWSSERLFPTSADKKRKLLNYRITPTH